MLVNDNLKLLIDAGNADRKNGGTQSSDATSSTLVPTSEPKGHSWRVRSHRIDLPQATHSLEIGCSLLQTRKGSKLLALDYF